MGKIENKKANIKVSLSKNINLDFFKKKKAMFTKNRPLCEIIAKNKFFLHI